MRRQLYVGSYTSSLPHVSGQGVGVTTFEVTDDLAMRPTSEIAASDVSYLAWDEAASRLYAVEEVLTYYGRETGSICCFDVDRSTGRLRDLARRDSHGSGPCHIAVSRPHGFVAVANYYGGTVVAYDIEREPLGEPSQIMRHAGSGPNPDRQESPHPHAFVVHPSGDFAYVPDLGTDEIRAYRLSGSRSLTLGTEAASVTSAMPGSGPRQIAFTRDGTTALVVNELASTLSVYAVDGRDGALSHLTTASALPDGHRAPSTAAGLALHPREDLVYVSNRGHDSIAAFRLDGTRGPELIAHVPTEGRTPRHFALDPSGSYLCVANQDSGSLVLFAIAPDGTLEAVSRCATPTPAFVQWA